MAKKSAKKTTDTSIENTQTASTGGVAVAEPEFAPSPVAPEPQRPESPQLAAPALAASATPAKTTPAKTDITTTQVQRQLDAIGGDRFRVALRSKESIAESYDVSKEELLKKVAYLKMMNVQGHDVLFKPIDKNNSVVMVDGLDKKAMNDMHQANNGPAAALEVAPGKYQVWVKLEADAIDAQQRREVAKMLTGQHEGNMEAANGGHYGRLAGFTNKDPNLTKEDGKQPWVKIQSAKGEALDKETAAELLTSANVRVQDVNRLLEQVRNQAIEAFKDAKADPGQLNPDSELGDPTVAFRVTAARLLERYGEGFEDAKADWVIAKDMAAKGWQKTDIAKAIEEASANIDPRKFDVMRDYANRTAGRAAATAKEEMSREKSKSLERGVER